MHIRDDKFIESDRMIFKILFRLIGYISELFILNHGHEGNVFVVKLIGIIDEIFALLYFCKLYTYECFFIQKHILFLLYYNIVFDVGAIRMNS